MKHILGIGIGLALALQTAAEVPACAKAPRVAERAGVRSQRRTSSRLYSVTAYCRTPRRTVLPAASRGGSCAADLRLHPVGTRLRIQGRVYWVSGAHGRKGRVIDIWNPDRKACMKFGRRHLMVEVVK